MIVRLEEGAGGNELAASYNTTVVASVPELNIYLIQTASGTSDEGFVQALESDSRTVFVELNLELQTAEGRQSTMAFSEGFRTWFDVGAEWALERVRAATAHRKVTGDSILVAVLDTGIDLDHPALASAIELPGIEPGVTAAPGDDRSEMVDTNHDGIVDGAWGHGTHVAGIIHAMAPDAGIVPVRVLDSDGVGSAFSVTRGLVAAVLRGAHVANLSLGMSDHSLSVAAAVDYAIAAGVVVTAPAGNAAAADLDFPASLEGVVAVAGTDFHDRKAWFSNHDPGVDVAAPADGVLSTYKDAGFARWSGTSMAVPFVTGTAALLYQRLDAGRSAESALYVSSHVVFGARILHEVDPVYAPGLGSGRVNAAICAGALEQVSGDGAEAQLWNGR